MIMNNKDFTYYSLSVYSTYLYILANKPLFFSVVYRSSAALVFPELFSDCSLEQLSTFLENANPSCLLDRPSSDKIYGGPVCGNAFLDPGEECDCGTVEVSCFFYIVYIILFYIFGPLV